MLARDIFFYSLFVCCPFFFFFMESSLIEIQSSEYGPKIWIFSRCALYKNKRGISLHVSVEKPVMMVERPPVLSGTFSKLTRFSLFYN